MNTTISNTNGNIYPNFPDEHPAATAAKNLRLVPEPERNKNLREFTAALEFDFKDAPQYLIEKYGSQVVTAVMAVVSRILKDPIDKLYADQYNRICSNVQAIARQIPTQETVLLR